MRHLSKGTLGLLLLCQSVTAAGEDRFTFFENFLQELRAKNYPALSDYVTDPQRFFVEDKLQPSLQDFVYGGDGGFIVSKGFSPLITILEMGPYVVRTSEPASGAVIFHVIPMIYAHEADGIDFYKDEWMRKYFACEFSSVDSRWQMRLNFCFGDSGGPYHRPYG